jgi:hypothetical protein
MSQGAIIAMTIAAAFLLFITARGSLGEYIQLLV